MKTTLFITLILVLFQPSQDQKDISGTWVLEENDTEIEITKNGNICSGTVIKSEVEKSIGKEVLKDFKKDGDVWKGKFYVVRRDRLVNATIKEKGDNSLELVVNAGRRSKTIMMTRAE